MSVDAIALLPLRDDPAGAPLEGGWKEGPGPGGGRAAWRALRDGKMVNLGVPFGSPDAHLHQVAAGWMGSGTPARVWVFPDVADPAGDTILAVQGETSAGGRWVEVGAGASQSPMESLGFTAAEAEQWRRVAASGDAKRISETLAVMRTKLEGRSNAELEAALAALLARK